MIFLLVADSHPAAIKMCLWRDSGLGWVEHMGSDGKRLCLLQATLTSKKKKKTSLWIAAGYESAAGASVRPCLGKCYKFTSPNENSSDTNTMELQQTCFALWFLWISISYMYCTWIEVLIKQSHGYRYFEIQFNNRITHPTPPLLSPWHMAW